MKFLKSKKLKWLSIPIAVVLAATLLVLYLPAGVSIEVKGILSLNVGVAYANPTFTARTETYARGSSLTDPFNFTIDKATEVVDGDIMFMFLAIFITSPPTVDSVPNGWTLVATALNVADGYCRWYLYYKIASSEGTNYTWSLTATCRYYALNIAYSSGDFDVASLSDITVSNTLYGTTDAIVRAASMNVPSANSPLVYFGAVYSSSAKTFTKPILPTTAWVEDADQGHTTPDLWLTNGSMIWAGSGATGNMDITCSASITGFKHAFAVALKPSVLAIIVSPTSYDFGVVVESSTPYTTTNYFTITNSSTMQTDQTISVTTANWASAGNPWVHDNNALPGVDTAGLKANRNGVWGTGDVIVKSTAPNYIYENCPANTSYSFGLKLWAPTSFSDGVLKQIVVRVSAVAG